jgi:hypothetical protein
VAEHPCSRSYGYVVRRRDLDWMVAVNAEARRDPAPGPDAIAPSIDRGFVRGAVVQTRRAPSPTSPARYVVSPTAPTAASAGRSARSAPRVALRHGDPHVLGDARATTSVIESALDVKDRNGNPDPATAGSSRSRRAP